MTVHPGAAIFPVTLDRTSPVPLYHQLSEQLTAAINRGTLKPGEALEREDLLARRLDISRPTLRRALAAVAAKGLLSRSRGIGTVITRPSSGETPAAGHPHTGGPAHSRTQLLRLEPDHVDPQVARELGLGETSRLVYLEQLVVVDGRPVSLRRSWLPTALVNPAVQDLVSVPARTILRNAGHAVVAERRTFGWRPADPAERAAFGLRKAHQVFTACGLAFDRKGVPVERSTTSYRRENDQFDALLAAG